MTAHSKRLIHFYQVREKILITEFRPASHSIGSKKKFTTTHWMKSDDWKEVDQFLIQTIEKYSSSLDGPIFDIYDNWTGDLIKISFTFKTIKKWSQCRYLPFFENANSSDTECLSKLLEDEEFSIADQAWKNVLVVAITPCNIASYSRDTPDDDDDDDDDASEKNRFPPQSEPNLKRKKYNPHSHFLRKHHSSQSSPGEANQDATHISRMMYVNEMKTSNECSLDVTCNPSSTVHPLTISLEKSIDLFGEENSSLCSSAESTEMSQDLPNLSRSLSPVLGKKNKRSLKKATSASIVDDHLTSKTPSKDMEIYNKDTKSSIFPFKKDDSVCISTDNIFRDPRLSSLEETRTSCDDQITSSPESKFHPSLKSSKGWLRKPQRRRSAFDVSSSEELNSSQASSDETKKKFEVLRYFRNLTHDVSFDISMSQSQFSDQENTILRLDSPCSSKNNHKGASNKSSDLSDELSTDQQIKECETKGLDQSSFYSSSQNKPNSTYFNKCSGKSESQKCHLVPIQNELDSASCTQRRKRKNDFDAHFIPNPKFQNNVPHASNSLCPNDKFIEESSKLQSNQMSVLEKSSFSNDFNLGIRHLGKKLRGKCPSRLTIPYSLNVKPKRTNVRIMNTPQDDDTEPFSSTSNVLRLRSKAKKVDLPFASSCKDIKLNPNATGVQRELAEHTQARGNDNDDGKELAGFSGYSPGAKEDVQMETGSDSEDKALPLPHRVSWMNESQGRISYSPNDDSIICDGDVPQKGNRAYLQIIHQEFNALTPEDFLGGFTRHLPLFRKLAEGKYFTKRSKLYYSAQMHKIEAQYFVKYMDQLTIQSTVHLTHEHLTEHIVNGDCVLQFALYVLIPELHRKMMEEFPIVEQFNGITEQEFESYFEDLVTLF